MAVHVGEGEKGTEHHVGEAASVDARMQTEAAREVREEEDCWQDAGGHEEETETCGANVQHARGWCAHDARTVVLPPGQAALSLRVVYVGSRCAYSGRTRHGCGKCTFQHRQKPIDRGLKPNVCFSVSTTTKMCTLNDLQ